MKRYIDADSLKNTLEKASEGMHLICGVKGVEIGAVIKAVDMFPTADVIEVVRCKDCVFCKYNTSSLRYKCDRRGYFTEEVEPMDFCSKAQKMGSEDTE